MTWLRLACIAVNLAVAALCIGLGALERSGVHPLSIVTRQ